MRHSNTASGIAADRGIAARRHMTTDELRGLGTHQVIYLRAGRRDGEWPVALYGADGVPLVIVDDIDTAVEFTDEYDLKIIAVH
jgi:hypothetical protein